MLAYCYADGGRAKQAINIANQGLILAPDSGKAKLALGYAYFADGKKQFPAALRLLESSIVATIDPLDQSQLNRASALIQVIKSRGK